MSEKVRHIDLSHIIEDGMVTYKGFPAPMICDWLSRVDSRSRYEAGTEFQIGRIDMVANTGTYIDSPFHRYADGIDVSGLPLENLAGVECAVVRIDEDVLREIASSTGGRYFRATDPEALSQVYAAIDRLERSPLSGRRPVARIDRYAWILALALGLVVAEGVLRGTLFRRLP